MIGRLADAYGRLRILGVLVTVASVVTFTIANSGPLPLAGVLLLSALFFVFASGRFVPAQAMISLAVPPARRGAFMSLSGCARDLASGLASTVGGWIVVRDPSGHLEHFNWLGWTAVAANVLAFMLARRVRVNEAATPTAIPQPQPVPHS
jgi:MFS family permease